MHTVILNADHTYLNMVPWQRAIKLIVKEKAEVLKEADKEVSNYQGTCIFKIPLVLRLVSLVKTIYSNKVPFSRKNVFIRDRHRCQYCGSTENLSVDHVTPRARGGKTNFENCVTCCVRCNVLKGDRFLEETSMKLLRRPYEPTIVEFLTYKMRHLGINQYLSSLNLY